MRFVPIKDEGQQAVLTVHRARSLLVSERTALVNHIRGLLSEYGVVLAQGVATVRKGLPEILVPVALSKLTISGPAASIATMSGLAD